jgi:hypothetical protein
MNSKRLLTLAKHLRTVPRKNFNMGQWCHFPISGLGRDGIFKHPCGTAGCAIGWATQIPEFYAAGLRLRLRIRSTDVRWSTNAAPVLVDGCDEVYEHGFDAVQRFFDLPPRDAEFLFGPGGNFTASQVADRIEDFVHGQYY